MKDYMIQCIIEWLKTASEREVRLVDVVVKRLTKARAK